MQWGIARTPRETLHIVVTHVWPMLVSSHLELETVKFRVDRPDRQDNTRKVFSTLCMFVFAVPVQQQADCPSLRP